MAKKRVLEDWINSREAARILTANSGHAVSDAYVRLLGSKGKLEVKQIDERTKLYKRADVETYIVEQRGKKEAA